METFGQFFNRIRIEKNYSLRKFCLDFGLDASNISKIERDILPPPKGEALERYANNLGLKKGSDDWYTFHDLAAAANRALPKYLTDEEIETKVPVVFRSLRESGDEKTNLKKLKDAIKSAWMP